MVKDPFWARFHTELWETFAGKVAQPLQLYAPDAWVPHIILANGDVDSARLICAIDELAGEPLAWEFEVTHLALITQEGQTGMVKRRVLRLGEGYLPG